MFYVYLVISAALIPILDNFFEILRHSYSWWLVPLLFIVFFLGLVIIHLLITVVWILTIRTDRPVKSRPAFRRWVNLTIPLLMKLVRVKVNAKGVDKVPENGRMLFVCNHQHDFDPVMLLSVFPDYDIGFIGKKEIYKTMPLIGKAMHGLCCLSIDRENNREAAKTIIEAVHILKEDKASIGLFPEGYVSKSCELLPFRNGSLKIACKAKVPIVVCVLNNTRSIPKRMFIRHTDIELRVLSVINPDEYEGMTTVELGDIIHAQMKTALDEIRNKKNN